MHGIQQSYVVLGFHPSFNAAPEQRFEVEFELNRLQFQRQHLAMESKYSKREVIFPNDSDVAAYGLTAPSVVAMQCMLIRDDRIWGNQPQLQAATAIAKLPEGTVPFIIFGP